MFNVQVHASILLPRLYRTRIYHCACAGTGAARDDCATTACRAVGPPSTKWNGLAFRPHAGPQVARDGGVSRGRLYASDIFRRRVVEFDVVGDGTETRLAQRRVFRLSIMPDNVRLDATRDALWVGAVGHTGPNLFSGIDTLVANATRAHAAARAAGRPAPRPHLLLRPSRDAPPQPPMLGGVLTIDLASGRAATEAMQATLLASVSWGMRVAGKLFMGSPWDDGVLVCS